MATIGVCDVGPVARLLATSLEARGTAVATWDGEPGGAAAFAAALDRPRRIVIATEMGPRVDAILAALRGQLATGDIVVHAGNERHEATARRAGELESAGITYAGLGVGLGPEVAQAGSTLMLGGTAEACEALRPLLAPLAAALSDGASIDRVGPAPAAHFVKVALMGCEYVEMHLLAEIAEVLRRVGGIANGEIADAFEAWNAGELDSLFTHATARIFRKVDDATGRSLVDLIDDASGMKPMGQWVVQSGFELGSPLPTLAAALASRMMMALKQQRVAAAGQLGSPDAERAADQRALVADARAALLASRLIACAETFAMLGAASTARKWDMPLARIARLWRAGSTIRSTLFERFQRAFERDATLVNPLVDSQIAAQLAETHGGLRRIVAAAVSHGIALPTLGAALAYFDAYRTARLPGDVIQAQRDFVGASKYRRTDRDGEFHTDW